MLPHNQQSHLDNTARSQNYPNKIVSIILCVLGVSVSKKKQHI